MTVERAHWRFTVDQFQQMVRTGILSEDDRVELIDGELIAMSPIGRRHKNRVRGITRLVGRRAGNDALIDVQSTLVVSDRWEPQPNIVLLRPSPDEYG